MPNERSADGALSVSQYTPIFGQSFEHTVGNTRLHKVTLVNGGACVQEDAMAVLSTSILPNSTAQLESKSPGKFRTGLGAMFRTHALFAAPIAGTKMLIGIADEIGSAEPFKNGYMIGYIGTTFGYHRFSNDTLITTPISEWKDSLDGKGNSRINIDQTKIGVWEFAYQYGGGGQCLFFEKSGSAKLEVAHIAPYANLNTEPSSFSSSFKFQIFLDNGAMASNVFIKCSSYSYFIQGKSQLINIDQPLFSSLKRQKTSVIAEIAIFTIRNKTTYILEPNFISAQLQNISVSIEADNPNNLATIRLIKNTTLGGSPSFSDINTTDSIMEIDTAGTTVTGGDEELSIQLAGKNDRQTLGKSDFDLLLNPGESLTISAESVNSATVRANNRWKELF